MSLDEAILKRVSVRHFSHDKIADEHKVAIINAINMANKASNLSITFVDDGTKSFSSVIKSFGMFKNVKSIIVIKGSENDINLYEKGGYYGEDVILIATNLGLGTCWVAGTFSKKPIDIGKNEKIVAVIPIGYPEDKNIFLNIKRNRKPLNLFYTSNIDPPPWFLKGVEYVREAPAAINKPKVHLTLNNDFVTASIKKTNKLALIDLGIAKRHFEIGAKGQFPFSNNAVFNRSFI